MSGIWVCATDQGRFFTSKNPEQAPNFELFSETGPNFLSFTPEQDPFLTIWSQTSKMPVAFLKNDRSSPSFLLKKCAYLLAKDTECVSVTISKLYSNKLMLPRGG